jgi:hypothetical protein
MRPSMSKCCPFRRENSPWKKWNGIGWQSVPWHGRALEEQKCGMEWDHGQCCGVCEAREVDLERGHHHPNVVPEKPGPWRKWNCPQSLLWWLIKFLPYPAPGPPRSGFIQETGVAVHDVLWLDCMCLPIIIYLVVPSVCATRIMHDIALIYRVHSPEPCPNFHWCSKVCMHVCVHADCIRI